MWLDAIRDIDPTFRRTVIVVSKFDNRLKVSISLKYTTEDRYLNVNQFLNRLKLIILPFFWFVIVCHLSGSFKIRPINNVMKIV